ncbi:glycine cleavage system protein H [Enterococcus florum]|uniref:Glycine cleavage system protein H n=1 Tax=Enterococcus florum TaxID=2480627 RepID=A0A4P5PAI6_9ENTE|nr:glycine cleavage system protein H [Enterococcus florum]GCF95107.1 glycine cleavage system protein H [Enterococcus florum]
MAHLKKKDGLWILHNDKEYCMGLTKEIQEDLGEISFVSFPQIGQTIQAGEPIFEVEAEKAVNEFKSPVTGVVSSINEKADKNPHALNTEDELDAWVLSLRQVDPEAFEKL